MAGEVRRVKDIGTVVLISIFISAFGFYLMWGEKTRWVGMVLVPLPWLPLLVYFCFCQRNRGVVLHGGDVAAAGPLLPERVSWEEPIKETGEEKVVVVVVASAGEEEEAIVGNKDEAE